MRIAYTIQNVGGIDFSQDMGDVVPVKRLLTGLQASGHTVKVVKLAGIGVATLDDVTQMDGFVIARLGFSSTRFFDLVERVLRRLQSALGLPYLALIDSFRFFETCLHVLPEYDICHEHNGLLSVGAAMACRVLGKPYILTVSADPLLEYELIGQPIKGLRAWVAGVQARFTYREAVRIICVSEASKQHLITRWGVEEDKIVVMPNGVDAAVFRDSAISSDCDPELFDEDQTVITFIGGFQPWHGVDILVKSFDSISRADTSAHLLLIGTGPAQNEIKELVLASGLNDRVTFTGLVPFKCIPAYLRSTDIAVLPYPKLPQELWFSPLKLYEYMAAGNAIVASRSGQISEVIKDGWNGVLVEPGNENELTESILDLIADPAKRKALGKQAVRGIEENHSWNNYVEKMINVYEEVSDGHQAI